MIFKVGSTTRGEVGVMRIKMSLGLAASLLPILSTEVLAERWICDLKSIYYHNDTKIEYTLDTEYWVKNRNFTSFEIDLDANQIRHLQYAASWKSKKIDTVWANGTLFELHDQHGVGYIITLFHPNVDDHEKKIRRYAWLELSGWNIELGVCRQR
jgi:hypothetical protein